MLDAMQADKKAKAGKLRFVLLSALGSAYVTDDVDDGALADVLANAGA